MDLRYPIGQFDWNSRPAPETWPALMDQLAAAPSALRDAVRDLDDKQLDTPYRPEGWTVRQLVHHLADSHMNMYIRLRFALTEEQPTIKPYDEKLWAELSDARTSPIEPSLQLMESMHQRWVALLRTLSPNDLSRAFFHPELGLVHLDTTMGAYAWHARHHTTQINALRDRMGWKTVARQAAT